MKNRASDSRDLLKQVKSDLPDGQISELPVQPHLQKYFCFSETQIKLYDSLSRPTEGRWPSSRTRGGMRWTRAASGARRDRRAGFRERSRCAQTNGAEADGEVVW